MLFMVEMNVEVPIGYDQERFAILKHAEMERARHLQENGKWRHLWRVAGQYRNVSIFDVESNSELHDILVELPLFPFMKIAVTPLCRHQSSIHEDDR